jgi:hypothetical protein
MKKLFTFILAFIYLTSSVGATVHLHYCMDKLVNWSLNDEGGKCKTCGMEKDGGCCKDEHKFVKNSLDQSATGAIQLSQLPTIDSPISFINITDDLSFSLTKDSPASHAPPINSGFDILIRNCVFRI